MHKIKIKHHVSFFTRIRYMGEMQEYYNELLKYYVKKYGLMQGTIAYSKKGFKHRGQQCIKLI